MNVNSLTLTKFNINDDNREMCETKQLLGLQIRLE